MLVSTAELMADRTRTGVVAFNVITVEHAAGIVAGAGRAGAPVILQLSENAIRYHGSPRPIAAALVALAGESTASVSLQLDHITDEELALRSSELGFSAVMFDASASPYEENASRTRDVAETLRRQGIYVEAELGAIGGKGGAHTPGVRTDPVEAAAFVDATGVDSLAVAVGSEHAMTAATAALDIPLIERLAAAVPVPLVLHGSSGVPEHAIVQAIGAGIVKVNIGTSLNVAFTAALREVLDSDAKLVDPRRYLRAGREAIADEVAARLVSIARS